MQATLAPSSNASLTARDRQLLAHPPYAQASIPETYRRHIVDYTRREQPGTILVDTNSRFLYYVLPGGKAVRYGVTVGEEALAWSGVATVGKVAEWPDWIPTAEIQARLGPYPKRVAGGPANPLGARALYLYEGNKDTLYRIHGTNQPEYIGHAISSGCIRMTQRRRHRSREPGEAGRDRRRAPAGPERLGRLLINPETPGELAISALRLEAGVGHETNPPHRRP